MLKASHLFIVNILDCSPSLTGREGVGLLLMICSYVSVP